MALQGTIETFALPDVMRLLASTKKTGRLRVSGSRGEGSVWVADGQVVAGETVTAHTDGVADVVFELLRFPDGDFVFEADELPDRLDAAQDVEPLLATTETRLAEWREIEAVVPSLDAWVTLAPSLTTDEVTIDRDRWSMIVRIGHGTSVGTLGDQLGLGELMVSRDVKDLVEHGLVVVDVDAPAAFVEERRAMPTVFHDELPTHDRFDEGQEPGFDQPGSDEPESEEPESEEPESSGPADELRPGAAKLTAVDDHVEMEPVDDFEPFDPDGLVLEPTNGNGADVAMPEVAVDTDPTDAAEIARQLANLSPKAAKAVAAAAKATTVEERERALADVDESEDVNRDLLIKFLGSVNS